MCGCGEWFGLTGCVMAWWYMYSYMVAFKYTYTSAECTENKGNKYKWKKNAVFAVAVCWCGLRV